MAERSGGAGKRRTEQLLNAPPETLREEALVNEVKRQTGQIEAINNVITAATRSPDLQQTLQTALDAVLAVVPLEASGISLIDFASGELVMWAQRGWRHDFTTTPMRVKVGTGMSGLVIASGEVLVTGDPTADSRLVVPAFAQENVKAMALAPMRARGKVIGVLSVMSHEPYNFSRGEVNVLQVIADQVGLALDNMLLVESVRAEQSRLAAVLHSTADAIIATDHKGRINLVNQAAESLFDQKEADLLGKPLRDAPFLPAIEEKMRHAMLKDEAEAQRVFEVSLEGKRYVLCQVAPVYSAGRLPEGNNEGWVVVFQDITHMKQAELARLHFIQTAAHELRNPLSVTLSALSMLDKEAPPPAEQEIFDIAFRGLNRMQDLLDDLLNLEHISSGVDLRFEPVEVADVIERLSIDMRPVLARKNQELLLAVAPDIPTFNGDERWLYRALSNLVGNAHKYTDEGSHITIRAMARQGEHGEELVLQVEDDGPGIPREAQTRLFERFYRVRHTEHKSKGTGLGLAIVKSVAEKHGGRAFVHSDLPATSALWRNAGATFGMVLPIREQLTTEES